MPPASPRTPGPSGHGRVFTAGCLGCLGLVTAGMGATLLFLIGSQTGPVALGVGILLACAPVPVYVSLALWLDRYEPEPPGLLLAAFVWGAVVAVFFSYLVNTGNAVLAYSATGSKQTALLFGAIVSAPVVEEIAKALALLILVFWKREEFEGVVDGVVYGSMVALGFAMTENFQYYGKALAEGGAFDLTVTFALRGVLSPFSHPLFTAFTGIGLGLARQSDRLEARLLAPPAGLACAMILHALWNGTASLHVGAWAATLFLVMLPAGLGVLGVVAFSLRHEGDLLRAHLQPEIQMGLLSGQDLAWLVSVWGRLRVASRVLFGQGLAAWQACERFNHLASELAFLRHRVRRRITAEETGRQLEAEIRQRMAIERRGFRV